MIKRMLLVILMVLCPFSLAWAGDWPQWRGPDRTGISKETGLLPSWPPKGPKLLWTFRDAGAGHSSMTVVGDRLYSMGANGNKEYVYAIDLNTRKKLWSVEVGARFDGAGFGAGPRGTPTIDGNFLYAIGGRGDLVCVETASGRKIWSQGLETSLGGLVGSNGYTESPLVDGDLVVVTLGGGKGGIAALDKKTGKVKWRSTIFTDDKTYSHSSMIAIKMGGVRQYIQIACNGGSPDVFGVRASDGKLLWKFPFAAIFTPIYQNDCVYVSGYGSCLLLKLLHDGDKFKAEQIYANREMQSGYWDAVLVGEYIYGYSDKGGWMCQDFKTGKTAWWKRTPNMGRGSITFADGNLYCYHENRGDVLLLKATPAGYQEQGRFRIPEETMLSRDGGRIWTHSVVANGKLYLRDQDLIFCYDIRKPQ